MPTQQVDSQPQSENGHPTASNVSASSKFFLASEDFEELRLEMWLVQCPEVNQEPEWYSWPLTLEKGKKWTGPIERQRMTESDSFEEQVAKDVPWRILILPCPPAGWSSIRDCIQSVGFALGMSPEVEDHIEGRYHSSHFEIGDFPTPVWLENDPGLEIEACSMLTFEQSTKQTCN